MTPQRRGVRFSDTNASDPSVVPGEAFSPTQLPTNERVLHSIFSPSYHQSKSGSSADQHGMLDRLLTPSKQPQLLFPEKQQNANRVEKDIFVSAINSQAQNLSPISAISAFTEGTSFWQQASWNHEKRSRVRFGPNNTNNTSFDTLQTIDMLNFKFIRACDSVDNLKRVLTILQQTRNDSPLLLEEAKHRMDTLEQQKQKTKRRSHSIKQSASQEPVKEEDSPTKEYFSACAANISRITNGNTTLDSMDPSKNSTLNLTLSPQSVLHGVNFVDTPLEEDATPFFPPTLMNVSTNTNNTRGAEKRLSPIEETSEKKNHMAKKEGQLSKEVQELSKQALALDASRSREHSSFVQKMQDLERAKKEAEKLVESLQGQVHQADIQSKDLEQVVVDLRTNQEKTQEDLHNERQALRKRDEEAKSLEKRLQTKIASLLEELKKSEESSRLVKGAEKGLRIRREQELSEQQEKNQELNGMLQEAYNNLESVKRRQSRFRLEMFRSMGMSITEVGDVFSGICHYINTSTHLCSFASIFQWRNMSHRDLLAELTGRIKIMREQNQTAQSMSEEKCKIIEERDRLDARLTETLREKETLQSENRKLSGRIQDLAQEVASSRAYIDKLLKTSQDVEQSDWESREEKYKIVIKNLRQQIRKQASAVSIDLYKNAVDDSKQNKSELKNAEKKIASLVSKVNQLEKEHNKRISPPMTSPEGKVAVRRVALSPTEYLKNATHSRTLGKPIRSALKFTSETGATNDETKHEHSPAGLTKSQIRREKDTESQHSMSLQKDPTPARHENLYSQKAEKNNAWPVPKYQASPASQQKISPKPKRVTTRTVENRQSKAKDALIGFDVVIPTDAIEKSQGQGKRMEEGLGNFSRTHEHQSNSACQYNTKKVMQAVQDRTRVEENEGNTFKSPLLIRRQRRLQKEATSTKQGRSQQGGSLMSNKKVESSPIVSKAAGAGGTENVDPRTNGKHSEMPSPQSAKKSSTPMKKARQLGGRRALADKLRKMRSPPAKPVAKVN